jgi:hypothetical protein
MAPDVESGAGQTEPDPGELIGDGVAWRVGFRARV